MSFLDDLEWLIEPPEPEYSAAQSLQERFFEAGPVLTDPPEEPWVIPPESYFYKEQLSEPLDIADREPPLRYKVAARLIDQVAPRGLDARYNFLSMLMPQIGWLVDHPERYIEIENRHDSKGKVRRFFKAHDELKVLLRAIDRRLLAKATVSTVCHGYTKGRSINSCVKAHAGSRYFLLMDFAHAFDTRVLGAALRELKRQCIVQGETDIRVLANWVSPDPSDEYDRYNLRSFPQGLATSPKLFNLACSRFDRMLGRFAANQRFIYTRYADNIFISSPNPFPNSSGLEWIVIKIADDSGWEINHSKTRFLSMQPWETTGVPLLGLVLGADGSTRLSNTVQRDVRRRMNQLVSEMMSCEDQDERERLIAQFQGIQNRVREIYGEAVPRILQKWFDDDTGVAD